MAKNFASLYATGNDAVALEQKVWIKEEVTRGDFALPDGSDELLINTGANVNFTQPIESSPVRSGRHHANIIEQKTSTEWTFPSYVHIDSSLGSAQDTEIDAAYRLLYKLMLGREQISPLTYDAATPPDGTFSIFQNGDVYALQAPGSFVNAANLQMPGDGDSTVEFSGMSKTAYLVGLGLSTTLNNGGNTVTLQDADEAERFPVGSKVMLILADGVTRSADTPDDTARTVISKAGAILTLDGAVLADADGSAANIYVCYFEPVAPVSAIINDPQTGLQGSVSIAGLSVDCVRSISISMNNNHEAQDFCFGEKGLASPFYVPGDRLTVELSLDLNLNHALVEFLNKKREFPGDNIVVKLGDPSGRHMEVTIPRAIFPVPEIPIPDTGTIPISFTGNAYTSDSQGEAADEITIKFL